MRVKSALGGVRLCELVASLSLATDLGLGLPQEHVLRQTLIADRIAALAGLAEADRACVRLVSLLAWVGCVADSHELSEWFGDELALRASSYDVDKAGLPMLWFMLGHLASDGPAPWGRVRTAGRFLATGLRSAAGTFVSHCQTTGDIASRLGLEDTAGPALAQMFERWDGHGVPARLRGEQISLITRIVQVADDAEVFHRRSGTAAALEMLASRRGTEFDPRLVDLCKGHAEAVFADFGDPWRAVIDGPVAGDRWIQENELDHVLTICADYADLKAPWWLGHSRSVAELAARAATPYGADRVLVRRAALVHRLGAVGVPGHLWAKVGALSGPEWERVRQVPYLTMRVLDRHQALAPVGRLAAQVRERMDGSGYPAGLTGDRLSPEARVLAAAQAYQARAEARPHRRALDTSDRVDHMRAEVAAGRLDRDAVRAVLGAAGHPVPRRVSAVAGLTARECEVLRLLVRGLSLREIAGELSISRRTAGAHVEHIYAKIGVSTRGAAAMFAMRQGIV